MIRRGAAATTFARYKASTNGHQPIKHVSIDVSETYLPYQPSVNLHPTKQHGSKKEERYTMCYYPHATNADHGSFNQCIRLHKNYCAYFLVHSRAVSSYLARFVLYVWAISGTKGSSGLGSVNNEQIDNNTFEIVSAGLHWSRKISRQMLPFELMFGW